MLSDYLTRCWDCFLFRRFLGPYLLQASFWLTTLIFLYDAVLFSFHPEMTVYSKSGVEAVLRLSGVVIILRVLVELSLIKFKRYEVTYSIAMRCGHLSDLALRNQLKVKCPNSIKKGLELWVSSCHMWLVPLVIVVFFYYAVGVMLMDVIHYHHLPLLTIDPKTHREVFSLGHEQFSPLHMLAWLSLKVSEVWLSLLGMKEVPSGLLARPAWIQLWGLVMHVCVLRLLMEQLVLHFRQYRLYQLIERSIRVV
ncbi:MAG: hypothetical protein CMF51_00400 [Legionellales bacterium]|nr:hypothetical protein [Legionellales bacterium]|tara:strand:- start:535 stop:1290 length:756 start_codon:yes stop_codon:yes gene_type:complete